MEVKKHQRNNLENYRTVFFLAGLVLALALMYGMFNLKWYNIEMDTIAMNDQDNFEQEEIPITRNDIELPPPPKRPQVTNQFQIVDDKEELKDIFDFPTFEDPEDPVDFFPEFDTENKDFDNEKIFVSVEKQPEPVGGIRALRTYISKNIRYPELARENGIEGTVVVQFVIEPTGKISNVTVIRSIDPLLDSEAVRVVSSLPKFKPGMQNGKPVRVWFTLPIAFKLQK